MARKARRRKKARKGYRRNAARKTAQKRSKSSGRFVKGRARKAAKRRRRVSARRMRAAWPSAKRKGRRGQTAKQRAASMRNLRKAWGKGGRKRKATKRKGKRSWSARGPRVKTLRRARTKIRWAKRTKPGSRSRKALKRFGLRSNPGAMVDAMKQVLPIAASFYGTRLIVGKLASVGAIGGMLAKLPMGGKLSGPVLSGIVLAGVHYGTKKGAMKKHRAGMMLGSAFALMDAAFNAFVPDSITGHVGVLSVASPVVAAPAAQAGYFPTNEYVPQSEYVAQDDYVAMSGYEDTDQSPRQLHEVWGVHGIEEELGSDHYGSLQPSW